jgi:DNA modification methylase
MAEIQEIEVAKLIPNPLNVKNHPKEQINDLAIQIQQEPGFTNPIIIDEDFMIWVGHGRLEAVKSLGWSTVPCITIHNMSEAEKYRYMIKDNQVNESPWDKEQLQIVYEKIDPVLFEPFQMNIQDIGVKLPIEEESDPIPEPPIEPKAKLGDVYQLGNHRVMCGDSTKYIETLLNGKTVDQLLTDPPYGVDYGGKNEFLNNEDKGNHIQKPIKNDTGLDYLSFFSQFLGCIPFSDYNTIYIFMGDTELNHLIISLDKLNYTITSYLIWKKPQFVLGRKDYHSQHEIIIYGWKGKHKFYGGHNKATVFETEKQQVNDVHPTMKPVEIIQQLVRDGSPEEGLVYDPFLGSGTTLIACEKTNRICYGMELDPGYIDVIIQRWENYTGKKAVKLPSQNTIEV